MIFNIIRETYLIKHKIGKNNVLLSFKNVMELIFIIRMWYKDNKYFKKMCVYGLCTGGECSGPRSR